MFFEKKWEKFKKYFFVSIKSIIFVLSINKIKKDMNELEKLEEEIDIWEKRYEEKENKWDWTSDAKTFEEYKHFLQPEISKLSELKRKLRMIMPYELSELPDFGDVMTLKHFIGCCKAGGFIDYDGYGHYVKDGKETDILIFPSDVKHNSIRKDFDTIIWYNR